MYDVVVAELLMLCMKLRFKKKHATCKMRQESGEERSSMTGGVKVGES